MLKLLNSVLLVVILCGGIQSLNGEALQCYFGDVTYFGTLYSCSVTALENPKDDKIIRGYNGVHKPNKYDTDVQQLYISEKDTYFIPEGLGSIFNITALTIRDSKLKEIRSKDFQGMQNLEYLSLYDNKLTSVPSDIFSTIPKLKQIQWHSNQIKYIGSGAFDQLTNLNDLYLNGNICVNKDYIGATAITQIKKDIKANCQNPNDIIQYEIEHKIRDESTRIRKESQEQFKALNEIVKQLFKAAQDHQMDRQENFNLKAELSTTKAGQDEVTKERDQLEKKLTDFKKENADLKEIIQQKLPKMEQLIEDFYMEVMDLKIERHHQRETSIALRTKLMEAKEQLAECQINERISC